MVEIAKKNILSPEIIFKLQLRSQIVDVLNQIQLKKKFEDIKEMKLFKYTSSDIKGRIKDKSACRSLLVILDSVNNSIINSTSELAPQLGYFIKALDLEAENEGWYCEIK